MKTYDFKGLTVWQKSMTWAVETYTATKRFPREELDGLTSQLRRAAVSIPSNIAEGHGRRSPKEFKKYLSIAYPSLSEAETQLLIAQRLGYLDGISVEKLPGKVAEVGRLLNGLVNSLPAKPFNRNLQLTTDN